MQQTQLRDSQHRILPGLSQYGDVKVMRSFAPDRKSFIISGLPRQALFIVLQATSRKVVHYLAFPYYITQLKFVMQN